uniref:ANF_receptor domain-containing protein n=1 Tax=Heterorhabditis bacteriophora TaxID=37862 RepID=A0A1I7XLM2_HETBA
MRYKSIFFFTTFCFSEAQTLVRLFNRFEWQEIAVLYYASRSNLIPRCSLVINDLEITLDNDRNMTLVYRKQFMNITNSTFRSALKSLKEVSRVIVVCLDSDEARRGFMIAVAEEEMDQNEYVWIMVESRRAGFKNIWVDTSPEPDGKDSLALRAARKFLVVCHN